MKVFRLTLAAFFTAVACFSYFYFFEYDRLYATYRCWQQAPSVSACYRDEGFDFNADLFGMRYEGNTANYVDRHIFDFGAFEKPILFILRDIMTSAYSNQGIFLDVGANTGQHSLFMSRYASEVHAFEPYEPVLKRFRRLVHINHIANIIIHPVGLGNENSKEAFYKPPDANSGTGSFVEGFKSDNTYLGELEIQVGDEALAKNGVRSVALMKIDIEGYEKLALQGLAHTLRRNRPLVVFELTTNPASPVSIKSTEELEGLFPANYDFLVIDDVGNLSTGKYRFITIEQGLHFDKLAQKDVLAYPEEKRQHIAARIHRP